MPKLSLADVVLATGGSLLRGEPTTVVDSFGIHTDGLGPGSLFFALPGTRTDGHKFLGRALERGAAAAVVLDNSMPEGPAPVGLIGVDDPTQALGRCAAWIRQQKLSHMKWVAITGSNGKTSTKELLAAGLSATRRVHRSPGNFNNELGVPLTVLACPEDAEVVVVELAMRAAGEIAELTTMTQPHVGVITNIRAVHLQFFHSLDDIAAAKGELFAVLGESNVAVYNVDDTHLRVQAARHAGPRVTFGRSPAADLHLDDLVNQFTPGAAMAFRHKNTSRRVQLHMGGAHAAYNALAALAVVAALDEDLDRAAESMAQLEAGPGRGKVHRLARDMMLVDDSYNSSPAALASVLDTLKAASPPGRKVLVMGDMLELGSVEGALHREAGKRAAAARVDILFAIGPLSRQTAESARRSGVPQVHHYADSNKAAESIGEFLRGGDLILVKGSRGMKLERVVCALTSALGTAD